MAQATLEHSDIKVKWLQFLVHFVIVTGPRLREFLAECRNQSADTRANQMKFSLPDMANWAQILSLLGIPLSVALWYFTKEKAERFWKRWQKTIFLLFGIGGLFALWGLGWLHWLSRPVTLPVWILLLLGIGGLLVGLIIWLIVHWLNNPAVLQAEPTSQMRRSLSAPPDWHNYVNDEIFGVRWQWGYRGNQIDNKLTAFCPQPHCRNRLEEKMNMPKMHSQRYTIPVSLVCPTCGFQHDYDDDAQRLKERVLMEIERRINTGEYEKRFRASA